MRLADGVHYPEQPFVPSQPVPIAFVTTVGMTQWLFLRGQMEYLRERGFKPYAISAGDAYLAKVRARDIPVVGVSFTRNRLAPWNDLLAGVEVYRALRRIRPTVVHASTPKASLIALAAAVILRVPVRVFLMRGTVTPRLMGVKRILSRAAERITASLATHVVFVSPSLQRFAEREGIVPAGKGVVLNKGMSNGINLARFSARREMAGTFRIGFVGRIARDKGIEELYLAWRLISERVPAACLILAGGSDNADGVSQALIRALEADPRVTLLGEVDDVASVYEQLDVLLLLSRGSEGFPNVPMEAAAARVPSIVTRVIGNVDAVVDGVTGFVVEEGDVSGIVDAVCRYAREPDLVNRHGSAARLRVEKEFSQEHVWAAHFEFLREASLAMRSDTVLQLGAADPSSAR